MPGLRACDRLGSPGKVLTRRQVRELPEDREIMDEVTVRFSPDFSRDELKAPVLIEGLPGIGHVGKLVAEHMIQELGAEKIAEIHSVWFPPQVIIGEDGVVRLANNELWFCDGQRQFIFLVGDHQSTSGRGHYILADQYLHDRPRARCRQALYPRRVRSRASRRGAAGACRDQPGPPCSRGRGSGGDREQGRAGRGNCRCGGPPPRARGDARESTGSA